MYGAIIGDIVGSRFEFNNFKSKDFELFDSGCFYTDDTVMTIAVAAALVHHKKSGTKLDTAAQYWMQRLGKQYIGVGYGARFFQWIQSDDPKPYNSWGNGSAMRVSSCGLYATSLEEAVENARLVTKVTHNHPEGIKGAEVVSSLIYLAKENKDKDYLREFANTYYTIDFTLDKIRPSYTFHESCQKSVPQAIECFLEAENFEDCIKNAISIGGDSDTIAAIAGSIAESYYGIEEELKEKARVYLDKNLIKILNSIEKNLNIQY